MDGRGRHRLHTAASQQCALLSETNHPDRVARPAESQELTIQRELAIASRLQRVVCFGRTPAA
jgi:hypothetical protein